jgi:8-oxo-dGTP diphosphatase
MLITADPLLNPREFGKKTQKTLIALHCKAKAIKHLIKIAGLPVDSKGRLLIVKLKGKPIWFSLGGCIEENETEETCLRREVKEELNVEVVGKVQHFCDTPIEMAAGRNDTTIVIKFYLIQLPANLKVDDDEIEDYRWIDRHDFEELMKDDCIEIGSGLVKYAIPKLIKEGIMR